MNAESLDEQYLEWLYRQVAPVRMKNPTRSYWSLLRQLHAKEFTWFVPNDDNRCSDGKYLRYYFVDDLPPRARPYDNDPWFSQTECSMLEMLTALARRLSFLAGGGASSWFWHMLDNIGLKKGYEDHEFSPDDLAKYNLVEEALDRVINRTYEPDGTGGLFPLKNAREDQTRLEIWYQMNDYLIENGRG